MFYSSKRSLCCSVFQVPDPYQWLEDPDAEETKAFVEAQNAVTTPFIEACDARGKLTERSVRFYKILFYLRIILE